MKEELLKQRQYLLEELTKLEYDENAKRVAIESQINKIDSMLLLDNLD